MQPLYQVVNEADEVIHLKPRHEINFHDDIYRIAALWLTNSRHEVLIAQRVMSKDKDPGKWGPAAAGTLEQNETYESNMYKEAEEEIGLHGVAFVEGPKQRLYGRQSFCQWYTATCDWPVEAFKLQTSEVMQIKWVARRWLERDVTQNPGAYVESLATMIEALM